MASTAYTWNVYFDLNSENANFKKIWANVAWTVSPDVDIFVEIKGPGNTSILTPNFSAAADIEIRSGDPSPQTWAGVDIPLDSDGNYNAGAYTVTFHVREGSVITPCAFAYTYAPLTNTDLDLTWKHDCFCGNITLVDASDYAGKTGFTLNSRSLTLIHPVIQGQPTIADQVTTTVLSLMSGFEYSNVTYTGKLTALLTKTTVNGLATFHDDISLALTETYTLHCDYDLNGLKTCILSALDGWNADALRLGGWGSQPKRSLDNYNKLVALIWSHDIAVKCQDFDNALVYYTSIKNLLNCACGCPSSEATGPVKMVFDCTLTQITGNQVTVKSSDGTVGVTQAILNCFELSIAPTAWTEITALETGWTNALGDEVRWRRNGFKQIEIYGQLLVGATATAVIAKDVWSGDNVPSLNLYPIPVFTTAGKSVGFLTTVKVGDKADLRITIDPAIGLPALDMFTLVFNGCWQLTQ